MLDVCMNVNCLSVRPSAVRMDELETSMMPSDFFGHSLRRTCTGGTVTILIDHL